ncbi:MAG: hypothetical protein K9N52_08320 [Verrucomicrobia bacterium]|nr:hypothetical protein [Verrucomicrobiota bacterium]
MKSKIVIVVLFIVCVGLGAVLYMQNKKTTQLKDEKSSQIESLSNRVSQAREELNEVKMTNDILYTNLTFKTEKVQELSNKVNNLSTQLAQTEANLKSDLQSAREEIAKRDSRISELENQRDQLSQRMSSLTNSIDQLESRIVETRRRLEASEGDRAFLLKELKRLQTEKAELERQLNDLSFLREQVNKLEDALSVARRLEWMRRGLYGTGLKGGQLLQRGFDRPEEQTNYTLDVEIKREGGAESAPESSGGE